MAVTVTRCTQPSFHRLMDVDIGLNDMAGSQLYPFTPCCGVFTVDQPPWPPRHMNACHRSFHQFVSTTAYHFGLFLANNPPDSATGSQIIGAEFSVDKAPRQEYQSQCTAVGFVEQFAGWESPLGSRYSSNGLLGFVATIGQYPCQGDNTELTPTRPQYWHSAIACGPHLTPNFLAQGGYCNPSIEFVDRAPTL